MSEDYMAKWTGVMGAFSGVMGGMFVYMAQKSADKDLVKALLENDWKTAIGRARTLARFDPYHWNNINLIVEQSAARAGHPVGRRGRRIAKLEGEIPTGNRYVKPSQKEWTPEEAVGGMIDPVAIRDPLTDQIWCVAERPFVGSRAGAWLPVISKLLEAAQTLALDPLNDEARECIAGVANDLAPSLEHYHKMRELIGTDMQRARTEASASFFDAFNTGKERRRQLLRRKQRSAGMWAD